MAKKMYENHTDVLQVVYDANGNKYEVVPNGTVSGDEAVFSQYGCLREKKEDKKSK